LEHCEATFERNFTAIFAENRQFDTVCDKVYGKGICPIPVCSDLAYRNRGFDGCAMALVAKRA
jgi:hypothetical protein